MKASLERDHDFFGEDDPPEGLVLSAPALLGIFFSTALLCAVGAGLAYSSGYGAHRTAGFTAGTSSSQSGAPAQQRQADNAAPRRNVAKPSPGLPPAPAQPTSASPVATPQAFQPIPDHETAPLGASAQPPPEPYAKPTPATLLPNPGIASQETAGAAAAVPPGTTPSVSSTGPAALPPTAAAHPYMVQIAAVTTADAAATLTQAVRHDGFAASVRTSDADHYFHVELGPFMSFPAAKAMKARLTADGYNAYIKP